MMGISYLFLAVFLAWGLSVVREDLARQKIPNTRIILGLKLLCAAAGLLAVLTFFGYRGQVLVFLSWNFYPLWAAHILWSALGAVILWHSEVWPAGDAKFFAVLCGALPLINPELRNFPHYLFLMVLINIFLMAALFAVGSFAVSGLSGGAPSVFLGEAAADLKKRFSSFSAQGWGRTAACVFNLAAIFLLQQLASVESGRFFLRAFSRVDMLYFFLFFLWPKLGKVFRSRRWSLVSVAFCALYLGAGLFFFRDRLLTMTLSAVSNLLRFGLLLIVGRFVFEFLLEKKDAVYLSAGEVVPGLVLSTETAAMVRENPVFEGAFEDCFRDGISAEQAELLRGWLKKIPGQSPRLVAVRGRPFALWILIGAAITLILNRNLAGLIAG